MGDAASLATALADGEAKGSLNPGRKARIGLDFKLKLLSFVVLWKPAAPRRHD